MMQIALPTWMLAFGIGLAVAWAGDFNETLKIGDAAPAWNGLPGVDGGKHSLSEHKDKKFVVVVFTCNSCPVAKDYEDRIIELANQFKEIAFVAINVNRIADDNLEKMTERAKSKSYPFAYLFDESQQIAKDFGANFTPEFFVLDGDRKIAYMGSLDDNTVVKQVKRTYLANAIKSLLAGEKPEVPETLARGCRIRFAKEARK
jgi:peroxiredoxin